MRHAALGIVPAVDGKRGVTLPGSQLRGRQIRQSLFDGFQNLRFQPGGIGLDPGELGIVERINIIERPAQHRSGMRVGSAEHQLFRIEIKAGFYRRAQV